MVRRLGLALTAAMIWSGGCAQPTTTQPVTAEDRATWSDVRRREFRAAFKAARRQLLARLLDVRIEPGTRFADLAVGKTLSVEELYNLACKAPVSDITWLEDGRCRVRLTLSLTSVVRAMDTWDRADAFVPHTRIYRLNRSRTITAEGVSPAERPRVSTD